MEIADNASELDNLGFRLPGSILNIQILVKESVQKALNEKKEDDLLFHYFLIAEANRCTNKFNDSSEAKIEIISKETIDEIIMNLGFSRKDIRFLKKIKKEFEYELI